MFKFLVVRGRAIKWVEMPRAKNGGSAHFTQNCAKSCTQKSTDRGQESSDRHIILTQIRQQCASTSVPASSTKMDDLVYSGTRGSTPQGVPSDPPAYIEVCGCSKTDYHAMLVYSVTRPGRVRAKIISRTKQRTFLFWVQRPLR